MKDEKRFGGDVTFISITRLRIRSVRFLPMFAWYTQKTNAQVKKAAGFLGGRLLPDRNWTFWTMTAWDGQQSMRKYITSGDHMKAMPKLLEWCDEASIVHWEQEGTELPSWEEADRRMRVEGRVSKVRNPSGEHAGMKFAQPRVTGSAEIRPLRS